MDPQRFSLVLAELESGLTAAQCLELERLARRLLSQQAGEAVIALRTHESVEERRCPHCAGSDVVKHGRTKNGRQRFRCRKSAGGCGRTFNGLTGTPLARMRKPELWLAYVRQMMERQSVDRIHRSGIPLSRLTIWRWRHRLLAVTVGMQAPRLDGIIEADETFFLRSFKGSRGWKRGTPPANRPPRYRGSGALTRGISSEHVPVLSALDRTGAVVEDVLDSRSSSEIERVLRDRVSPGALLCVDGAQAYRGLANAADVRLKVIPPAKMNWLQKAVGGSPRRPGRLTLGRVNSHHSILKSTLNIGFRGVSTRYLPHYLGLLRVARQPNFTPEALIRAASENHNSH